MNLSWQREKSLKRQMRRRGDSDTNGGGASVSGVGKDQTDSLRAIKMNENIEVKVFERSRASPR